MAQVKAFSGGCHKNYRPPELEVPDREIDQTNPEQNVWKPLSSVSVCETKCPAQYLAKYERTDRQVPGRFVVWIVIGSNSKLGMFRQGYQASKTFTDREIDLTKPEHCHKPFASVSVEINF